MRVSQREQFSDTSKWNADFNYAVIDHTRPFLLGHVRSSGLTLKQSVWYSADVEFKKLFEKVITCFLIIHQHLNIPLLFA